MLSVINTILSLESSKQYLSVTELSDLSGIKKATLRKAIRENRLPASVLNPGASRPHYAFDVARLKDYYSDLMK